MPGQTFTLLDYLGAPIVFVLFFVILFVLSVGINFTMIEQEDDITSFEKLGARRNIRLGPHSVEYVKMQKAKAKRAKIDRSS